MWEDSLLNAITILLGSRYPMEIWWGPEMDGYSFVSQLRDMPGREGAIPAVALTACARSGDRTKALRSGFQMHIAKPVEPGELAAVVASLGGKPRKLK